MAGQPMENALSERSESPLDGARGDPELKSKGRRASSLTSGMLPSSASFGWQALTEQ